ncbi:unnamed protein product [Moneuplotes crassus]|uniref:Uncharacterized protein n=1 Tax=Euplotes crassus TaxID=5936 RepID=A0AAD1X4N0_EUPCR|nr:unnamed protein product [Moneuplotes crassus]
MQFLEELGCEDIFNSQEAKEIKTMFSKNPQNMSKNKAILDAIHKFDADYDDEIKENLDEAQSQNGSNGEEQKEEQVSDEREMGIRTKNFMRFRDHDTYSFKGHLDTVRNRAFVPHLDQAITVSEDCTIRLLDLGNIDKESYKNYENFEHNYFSDGSEFAGDSSSFYSYCTLRGHPGIVTKIEVDRIQIAQEHKNPLFYTAGVEGIIRAWRVPKPEDIKQFENEAECTAKLCQYVWEAHPGEMIWDLKYHNTEPLLLSTSADGIISLWNLADYKKFEKLASELSKIENKIHSQSFILKVNGSEITPTCLDWCKMFASSFIACSNNDIAGAFDYHKSDPVFTFECKEPRTGDPSLRQVNCVECHPTMNIAITGAEDEDIGIFDLEAKGKCLRMTENTHTSPISSIAINPNGINYASSSHDGTIRFWDIRMQQLHLSSSNTPVSTSNGTKMYGEIASCHDKKFGESICSLKIHSTLPILMSCGGDSNIKLHIDINM